MGANLTKDWIQYLKNNRIAAQQSDPKSNKINYKRSVTASDVINFLQVKTDYTDRDINKAIDSVVGARSNEKTPTNNNSADNRNLPATQQKSPGTLDTGMTPGRPAPRGLPAPHTEPTKPQKPVSKYASTNSDAEDIEPRYGQRPAITGPRQSLPAPATSPTPPDPAPTPGKKPRTGGKVKGQTSQTPDAIRKHQARANRKGALTEDFVDDPGEDLSEKDVELIFKILAGSTKSAQLPAQSSNTPKNNNRRDPATARTEEIEKLKSVISTQMSSEHRKQLWDALQGSVNEAYVEKSKVKQIFNYLGNNRSSQPQNLDINGLQKAWASAGYPDDTADIAEILKRHGFDESAINTAFSGVLGKDYDEEDSDSADDTEPSVSSAVLKIADYIKRAGISKEIIEYMQENYANELSAVPKQGMFSRMKTYGKNLFKRKATSEDVRQIFTNILKEERRSLPLLLKQEEYTKLGRNKK